jgi:hypothetical protein
MFKQIILESLPQNKTSLSPLNYLYQNGEYGQAHLGYCGVWDLYAPRK